MSPLVWFLTISGAAAWTCSIALVIGLVLAERRQQRRRERWEDFFAEMTRNQGGSP